jgi:hypothetical protein
MMSLVNPTDSLALVGCFSEKNGEGAIRNEYYLHMTIDNHYKYIFIELGRNYMYLF